MSSLWKAEIQQPAGLIRGMFSQASREGQQFGHPVEKLSMSKDSEHPKCQRLQKVSADPVPRQANSHIDEMCWVPLSELQRTINITFGGSCSPR